MDGLDDLKAKYLVAIANIGDEAGLEELRLAALGKKGEISALMSALGKMDPDARKAAGAMLNVLKDEIDAALLFWGTMKNRSRGVSVSDEVRRKREDLAAKVKALRGRRLYYVAARDHAKGMRESFP